MPFIIVFVGDEGFSRHLFVDTHKFLARGGAECSRRGESHPSALSCADFLLKASLFRCHRFESLIPANRKNQKNNHPLVDDYFSGFILLGMRDSSSPKISREYTEKFFLRSLGFLKSKIVCFLKIPFESLPQ
jgi:hypothetical protein